MHKSHRSLAAPPSSHVRFAEGAPRNTGRTGYSPLRSPVREGVRFPFSAKYEPSMMVNIPSNASRDGMFVNGLEPPVSGVSGSEDEASEVGNAVGEPRFAANFFPRGIYR